MAEAGRRAVRRRGGLGRGAAGCAGLAGLVLALGLASGAARAGTVHDLEADAVHRVTPGDAECFTQTTVTPVTNDPLCPIRGRSSCEPGGEASLDVLSCVTLRAVSGGAHGHYQFWFRVMPAASDASSSGPTFVPVHILASDVAWYLKLTNGSLTEEAGVSSASFFLRLRRDPVGDLFARGALVTETPVLLASHGGLSGCLSIPTGIDDIVNLAISCQLASAQFQNGRASPSLSAIVEVGRTYSVELAMDLEVHKRATVKPTSVSVGNANDRNDPPNPIGNVMKWDEFVITVGSSSDDLQAQIDDLQAQVDALRLDLEFHSHPYLTGRGAGHNKVETSTGLPRFPDGGVDVSGPADDYDGDGVLDAVDVCPASAFGAAVDLAGCTRDEFCSLQGRSTCRRADWADDEGGRPRDCRWRRGACQARH